MADVEMTDAPKTKSSKAGPSGDAGENKPRFEVKKVCCLHQKRVKYVFLLTV